MYRMMRVHAYSWKEKASSKKRVPQDVNPPGRGNSVAISPIAWQTNTSQIPITTYARTIHPGRKMYPELKYSPEAV